MSIISYAQNFEDVMLWRALQDVERGFYIDIGANDPRVDSVSLAFHELGWTGIHLEPVSEYAEALRRARPNCDVIEGVVGTKSGLLNFFEVAGTGLSTLDPTVAASHEANGFVVKRILKPSVTLDEVLALRDGPIHWLKIDVEGHEAAVIKGWKGSARPWILVIESTRPGTQTPLQAQWEERILDMGYAFAWFDGLNRFYVSDEQSDLLERFNSPPNVFDGFRLSGEATASFTNLITARIAKTQQDLDAALNDAATHRDWSRTHIERIEGDHVRERDGLIAAHAAELEQIEHALADALKAHATEERRLTSELAASTKLPAERIAAIEAQKDKASREYEARIEKLTQIIADRESQVSAQLQTWAERLDIVTRQSLDDREQMRSSERDLRARLERAEQERLEKILALSTLKENLDSQKILFERDRASELREHDLEKDHIRVQLKQRDSALSTLTEELEALRREETELKERLSHSIAALHKADADAASLSWELQKQDIAFKARTEEWQGERLRFAEAITEMRNEADTRVSQFALEVGEERAKRKVLELQNEEIAARQDLLLSSIDATRLAFTDQITSLQEALRASEAEKENNLIGFEERALKLRHDTDNISQKLSRKECEFVDLEKEVARLQLERDGLSEVVNELRTRERALATQISDMENSIAWRVFHPFWKRGLAKSGFAAHAKNASPTHVIAINSACVSSDQKECHDIERVVCEVCATTPHTENNGGVLLKSFFSRGRSDHSQAQHSSDGRFEDIDAALSALSQKSDASNESLEQIRSGLALVISRLPDVDGRLISPPAEMPLSRNAAVVFGSLSRALHVRRD